MQHLILIMKFQDWFTIDVRVSVFLAGEIAMSQPILSTSMIHRAREKKVLQMIAMKG